MMMKSYISQRIPHDLLQSVLLQAVMHALMLPAVSLEPITRMKHYNALEFLNFWLMLFKI